ncbi:hypothetical protein CRYO30217_01963 [Parvicella tangerina]|uniref:Uncharacterized protein n=2 Tax=Parvicella tangerina TaxID=2829795 RepID=A0A916NBA5_9FLAO|nr:hypothetical protein CRYO30217_01963 [Parvicella tangerina]
MTIENKTEQTVLICYKSQNNIQWLNRNCDTIKVNDELRNSMGLGTWPRNSGEDFIQSITSITFCTDTDSVVVTEQDISNRIKAKVKGIYHAHLKISIKP